MKLSNFCLGLEILRHHFTDRDGYHLGAEHDTIYVFATESPLPTDTVERLIELGWVQPYAEHNPNGEFRPEYYNPGECWAAHV